MAKAFLYGNGGSGGGLNFSVVGGTTAPSNPKENMIWVNTSTTITSWIFSAIEPSTPASGMVWISTGTSSTVEFNALKKNGIQVYPLKAKQYVNGAWVDKDAYSYQSGAWVKWWDGELFDNGDEFVDITGGWSAFKQYVQTFDGSLCGIQDGALVAKTNGTGGSSRCAAMAPENAIDMTDYSTIVFYVEEVYNAECVFGVSVTRDSSTQNNSNPKSTVNNPGIITLDISTLTGKYYPWFGNYSTSTHGAKVTSVKMLR